MVARMFLLGQIGFKLLPGLLDTYLFQRFCKGSFDERGNKVR